MIRQNKTRRGFTLTEVAIVLMVIGLVTSVIWVAGQRVWSNYRIYRVNQQIAEVVQNIRDYYGNTIQAFGPPASYPVPGFTAGEDITAILDGRLPNNQIFPAEMRRNPSLGPGNTPIDHAFNNSLGGGSFHVEAVQNAVSTATPKSLDAFRLQIEGLTTAACIQLLMTAPLTSDVIGYVQVQTVNSLGVVVGGPAVIKKGASTTTNVTPMILATANTWCASATEVDFDFSLHN